MIIELIKLATHLDERGLVKEADYLDAVIKKATKDFGSSDGLWDEDSRRDDEYGEEQELYEEGWDRVDMTNITPSPRGGRHMYSAQALAALPYDPHIGLEGRQLGHYLYAFRAAAGGVRPKASPRLRRDSELLSIWNRGLANGRREYERLHSEPVSFEERIEPVDIAMERVPAQPVVEDWHAELKAMERVPARSDRRWLDGPYGRQPGPHDLIDS